MLMKLLPSFVGVMVLSACAGPEPINLQAAPVRGAELHTTSFMKTPVLSGQVFFAYDQHILSGEARSALEPLAKRLKQYTQVAVLIEGHADERGTRDYNLALGERRAQTVKDYLMALGIPAHRLSTISYGKERPQVSGSNQAAWSQNRRAVLIPQVQ